MTIYEVHTTSQKVGDVSDTEFRYHMLRPAEIVRRRNEKPVAYIPLGTLEWHGPQNAVGADTLQAEGIAVECARQGGGLVFPPLYYGESRLESLMEATSEDRELIAKQMGLPWENFSPERHPFTPMEQAIGYHKLLIHILAEVESLGFEVGVLVCGHYPLYDHARAAALQFNQREHSRLSGMHAWTFVDYMLVGDDYEHAGDHAAGWETSHMMALHPETVDLSTLPPEGQPLVGIMGRRDPRAATAKFGRETIERAAHIAVREVEYRLQHRDLFRGHGQTFVERQWHDQA